MEDNKRPNAALINREWFESAKSVLSAEALGRVLVAACNYVIFNELEPKLSGTESVVFAMIRPALDSDITRYLERCARNAANAKSQRKRVGASGSDSQRVGAIPTTTPTPTSTPTSTPTPSLSLEEVEEREKWLLFGYFWSSGSKAVFEELKTFWSYYEALGWKNNKGAAIVSKVAAARMWRRQFETGSAPNGADAWFKAVQTCSVPNFNVWQCYAGAERTDAGAVVRLRCSEKFKSDLLEVLPDLKKTLQGLWKVPAVLFERIG